MLIPELTDHSRTNFNVFKTVCSSAAQVVGEVSRDVGVPGVCEAKYVGSRNSPSTTQSTTHFSSSQAICLVCKEIHPYM